MTPIAVILILAFSVSAQSHRMSHDKLMRRLQAEATKRKVYFRIWCTARCDEEGYMAIATKGGELNIYAEDGAGDYWSVSFFSSADDAAYALLLALRNPPNQTPQHRRPREKRLLHRMQA